MIVVHEFAALGKIGADDRPVAVGEQRIVASSGRERTLRHADDDHLVEFEAQRCGGRADEPCCGRATAGDPCDAGAAAAATSGSNSFCNNRIWASAARTGGCPPLRKHLLDCPKCCDRSAARGRNASVPRRLAGQGPKARDWGAGAPRVVRRPT